MELVPVFDVGYPLEYYRFRIPIIRFLPLVILKRLVDHHEILGTFSVGWMDVFVPDLSSLSHPRFMASDIETRFQRYNCSQ
jgi:hypothetical protein